MRYKLAIKLLAILGLLLVLSTCSSSLNSPRKDPMWSNGHNK